MELPVRNTKGEVVGQVELSDDVFGVSVSQDLMHQVLVYHQANQRQGTHKTKKRDEVSGGGRKPYAQKHTGRARQGSIRSPQFRHGGVVFGPQPRSYAQRLPKKMRQLAIRGALSGKAANDQLVLLQDLDMGEAKTKALAGVFAALGVQSKALLVLGAPVRDISLAARNLPQVKTLTANLLNVLDLARYDKVVMTVETAKGLETFWAAEKEAVSA